MQSEEQIEAAARADAEYAGRTFDALSSADKTRFRERAKLMLEAALPAAPPAPSVAVKALEWEKQAMSHGYGLFIRLARTSIGDYQISHGTAGKYEVYFNKGPISAAYDSVPEAKAAAQADYEARIRSALSAQVQDADEQRTETCQRCQGNGEIVTDWERYRHLHENDVGDEAVAECPDCDGIGKVSAQVQDVAGDEEWQLVPKHPTGRMIDAVISMVDADAPHPFILNIYRAMLSAAPAKQEGGETEPVHKRPVENGESGDK